MKLRKKATGTVMMFHTRRLLQHFRAFISHTERVFSDYFKRATLFFWALTVIKG